MFSTSDFTLYDIKNAVKAQRKDLTDISNNEVIRSINFALNIYRKYENINREYRTIVYSDLISINSTGYDLNLLRAGGAYTAWATSTAYTVGDIVKHKNRFYECATSHTSTTFFSDFVSNARWTVYNDVLYSDWDQFEVCLKGASATDNQFDERLTIPQYRQNLDNYFYAYEIREDEKLYLVPQPTESNYIVIKYAKKASNFGLDLSDDNLLERIPIERECDSAFVDFIISYFYGSEGEDGMEQKYIAEFERKLRIFFQGAPKAVRFPVY